VAKNASSRQAKEPSTDDETLGGLIRSRRRIQGLTLQQMGEGIGRSTSYASQVERGLVSPSLNIIKRICEVLSMPLSWLVSSELPANDPPWLVRRKNRREIAFPSSKMTKGLMTHDAGGQLQLVWLTLEPGANSGDEPWVVHGETAGTVIAGSLDLWVDEEVQRLNEGDTYRFQANKPHRVANAGDTLVEVVLVATPPYY